MTPTLSLHPSQPIVLGVKVTCPSGLIQPPCWQEVIQTGVRASGKGLDPRALCTQHWSLGHPAGLLALGRRGHQALSKSARPFGEWPPGGTVAPRRPQSPAHLAQEETEGPCDGPSTPGRGSRLPGWRWGPPS